MEQQQMLARGTRWGDLLEPWRPYFKQVDRLFSGDSDVHVDLIRDTKTVPWRESVWRLREALELLALVELVESVSKGEMPWQQYECSGCSVLHCHTDPRRYVIHRYNKRCLNYKSVSDIEVYSAFFFAFDEHSLRDEFRRVVDEIYHGLTPELRTAVKMHWWLPVWVDFSGYTSLPVAYLQSALEFVKRFVETAKEAAAIAGAAADQYDQWQYQFPYTDSQLRLCLRNLEHGAAPILTELLAMGVQLTGEIDIGGDSALGRLPFSELGPVLHAITDGSSLRALKGYEKVLHGDAASKKTLRMQNWGPAGRWHARVLQAVCSSLAGCKDFRELNLGNFPVETSLRSRRKILQWLAYALFSKDSTTSISSLTLADALWVDDDMDGIMDMLKAKNPAKHLLDGDSFQDPDASLGDKAVGPDGERQGESTEVNSNREVDEDPGFASLKAGTTISIAPIDDDDQLDSSPESLVLKQDGLFRVMRDDKSLEWVDIVVPSYGFCVVRRASVDHLVPAASQKSSVDAGYGGSITSLELRDSDQELLLPLIEFIGSKLLSLAVNGRDFEGDDDGKITADYLRQVLRVCPNLTSLQLIEPDGDVVSVFVEAYRSGGCKIERLGLHDLLISPSEPIMEFVGMLQDPTSAAGKTIRYLKLQTARHHLFEKTALDAVCEMLQVNRTLEYLEIKVCESLTAEYEPKLMRTHGQRVVRSPLCQATRYAFLTILEHTSSAAQAAAEPPRKRLRHTGAQDFVDGRLGRATILSIFAFAAEGATRKIEVLPVYEGY
ncbi:hypothetical protein Gpo141_00010941 [Globisporangium polare]